MGCGPSESVDVVLLLIDEFLFLYLRWMVGLCFAGMFFGMLNTEKIFKFKVWSLIPKGAI